MSRSLCFCLLFGSIFAIFNCVEQTGIQPSRVLLVSGVADTCRVERGIDAIPESNAICIEWIPNPEDFIEVFDVYRSVEPKSGFRPIGRVDTEDHRYIDHAVVLNRRYFYYVLAVGEDGLESEPSDTLTYMLLHKPTGMDPNGILAQGVPDFSWHDPNKAAAYIVRVVNQNTDAVIWIRRVPSSYSGDREHVLFNDDGVATLGALIPEIDYRWRVDVEGPEKASGSESPWIGIRVQ